MEKTNRVNENDQRLIKMPSIMSGFPLKFKSGMVYENVSAKCSICSTTIPDNELHGELVPHGESMIHLEARGYCKNCNVWTPVSYRIYSDGRFMGIRDGKWITYHMKKEESFFRKLVKILFW